MRFDIVDPKKDAPIHTIHTSQLEMFDAMTLFRESYMTLIMPPEDVKNLKSFEGKRLIFCLSNPPHVSLSYKAVMKSIEVEADSGMWIKCKIVLEPCPEDVQKSLDQISDLLGEIIEN